MMPALNEAMLAVSSSPAASIVVKATVVTALALGISWLARRSRAAVRHTLLAASFGVLLALPLVSLLAPPVRIVVAAAEQGRSARALTGFTQPRVGRPLRAIAAVHAASQPAVLSLSNLLLMGWIVGMALFLAPVAMGLWQVRRLRRSALPWQHGRSVVETLALGSGVHRHVEALLHEAAPGPMTCGIAHPVIVLPPDAQNWPADDLERAIVHVLEHVRRGDWAIHCVARIICAAYWFHPLVWIAWRRLALEAERSCDDAVLSRSEATAYADQLVGLARRLSATAKSPVLAMANRADLTARVGAVLDSRQRRGRAGAWRVALACAAAAALVLVISPLQVVAAQQPSATPDAILADLPHFAVNTGLVMVDVTVSDQSDKAIEGLSVKDFAITEFGVPQTISVFEFQEMQGQQGMQSISASYYVLGYYTPIDKVDDRLRKIKVAVPGVASAKLDYRPGYYASRPGFPARPPNVDSVHDANAPAVISKVEPEYSDYARKAKFQGTAVILVDVSASGHVTNARVIKSLGLGLDEKAVDAVKQWKFSPGTKDGKPVATQAVVEANFRLL